MEKLPFTVFLFCNFQFSHYNLSIHLPNSRIKIRITKLFWALNVHQQALSEALYMNHDTEPSKGLWEIDYLWSFFIPKGAETQRGKRLLAEGTTHWEGAQDDAKQPTLHLAAAYKENLSGAKCQ